MRKFLPVLVSLGLVGLAAYFVIHKKHTSQDKTNVPQSVSRTIDSFVPQHACARLPGFLHVQHIPRPVMIDLSQKRFKGLALLYGKHFNKALHPKQWEQYEYFSTYAADPLGNIYLVPMPFISIGRTTFNLQKNIYRLDSNTGKVSIFMHFDDVLPSANNPYGLIAIVYDCDDNTLWVSAIDESDYSSEKGVIYHIDPGSKKILQRFNGIDALSMAIVKSNKNKYLLVGSARDNALYAYRIGKEGIHKPKMTLLSLPNANEHIRKIKVRGRDHLQLQTIPFSYALIAQTGMKDRSHYTAFKDPKNGQWMIQKTTTK
jgi:hypothetical protein